MRPEMRLPGSPELYRFGGMLAIFVASGLGITYLVLPPAPDEADAPRPAPELRVAGMPVPAGGDRVANALDRVRRYAAGEITLTLPGGATRKVRRGALGAEIDRVRLADFVKEADRPASAVRRAHDRATKPGAPLDVPLPVALDADLAIAKLLDIKAELDTPARDATIDLEKRELKREEVGYRLDVYGTLARIDAALRRGDDTVEAAVETIAPKLTAAELGNVKFDHVLGYFETRYSQGGKAKERTYNLRLAASKLDGTVVMPGQTFDFNGTVGPRDEAHGYRIAPVIAEGELVDGLGGGTCQISGTLHGAAFFAGLHMVERYPHSRPSFYIKLGLDATVVYPSINFRFRNDFDAPIVLHETVANGVVRAEILGAERKLTVSYFRRIDEVVPFEEVERKTPKLPEGVRVLAQRGIPGFRTSSSRVVRDGAYAVREKWSDAYPPTTQIIHVGTGPKDDDDKKAQGDAHPEYVVDEYLVVTQGPEIHTPGASGPEPGGGTVESREPGKTGEHGWTEASGLSRFHAKDDASPPDDTAAEGARTASLRTDKDGAPKDGTSKDDADKPRKKKKKKKKPDG
jgi:vancomycin resistance protein YoaR